MKKWGIRARVLFLALLPSVMILLTLVGYFTYTRIAEVDVVLAQRGNSLARQLAPGAEFALFAGDTAALDRLAQSAVREADVASVTITDARGRVVAGATSNVARNGDAIARFTQPVLATRLDTADIPEQMGPSGTPAKVGEITVAMSRASARAAPAAFAGCWVGPWVSLAAACRCSRAGHREQRHPSDSTLGRQPWRS